MPRCSLSMCCVSFSTTDKPCQITWGIVSRPRWVLALNWSWPKYREQNQICQLWTEAPVAHPPHHTGSNTCISFKWLFVCDVESAPQTFYLIFIPLDILLSSPIPSQKELRMAGQERPLLLSETCFQTVQMKMNTFQSQINKTNLKHLMELIRTRSIINNKIHMAALQNHYRMSQIFSANQSLKLQVTQSNMTPVCHRVRRVLWAIKPI